jgi:hypothetical protein
MTACILRLKMPNLSSRSALEDDIWDFCIQNRHLPELRR